MLLERDVISVLSLDCEVEAGESTDVTTVHTGRAALAALRVLDFDLLVTGSRVGDEPVWRHVAKVRTVRPRLRWMLVSPDLSPVDEVMARSLGATWVFGSMPSPYEWVELFDRIGIGVRPVATRGCPPRAGPWPGRRV